MTARQSQTRLLMAWTGCLVFFAASQTHAQTPAQELPLFKETTALEFELAVPLRALRRDSRARPERDGYVKYTDSDGAEVILDVEVRVRGNSRLASCDFPPLRLDFRRSQVEGTIFAGQNRLKLVTLCKSRDNYRDYLHLEHDIYKLFNVITDHSFRVRPGNVEYRSTDSRREEKFTEHAFLIEEDWEVAERSNLDVIEQQSIEMNNLDPRHTALLSIFQFLIGNTDWSPVRAPEGENCCHNGKVIGRADSGYIVLPYDFDQAGLINTDYARPADLLPIRTVRQRLFRGYCIHNGHIDSAARHIVDRRDDLEDVLQSSAVSDAARSDALEYLRDSLNILADPDRRNSEIMEACRS